MPKISPESKKPEEMVPQNPSESPDAQPDAGSGDCKPDNPESKSADSADKVKRTQNFIVAATVVGFAALLFGSLLFGLVGLIMALVGLRKVKNLGVGDGATDAALKRLRRTAWFALVISACAMIISATIICLMYPYIIEFVENGSLDALMTTNASTGTGATTNSTWG